MITNVIFENGERSKIELTGQQLYDITVKKPARVADGFYRGFHFYILTMGSHPCAYVDVGCNEFLVDVGCNEFLADEINCHGGITYCDNTLATVPEKSYFIGWDYAHYNDFLVFNDRLAKEYGEPYTAHKYTLSEIVKECGNVIDQIITLLQG